MSKLSVAIADDNEKMLRLLENIVSGDEELCVVGTAKDGEEKISSQEWFLKNRII